MAGSRSDAKREGDPLKRRPDTEGKTSMSEANGSWSEADTMDELLGLFFFFHSLLSRHVAFYMYLYVPLWGGNVRTF